MKLSLMAFSSTSWVDNSFKCTESASSFKLQLLVICYFAFTNNQFHLLSCFSFAEPSWVPLCPRRHVWVFSIT